MLIPWFALLSFQDVPPQYPGHYAATEMICPVGGETFQGPSLMHYSTFGAMPDGMPVGSILFPILLPECPSNGLPLFREFDADEAARLAPLLASEAWEAVRASETPYYRAYWLEKRLGDARNALWLLLSAGWEAKNAEDRERADRYGTEFVEQALAVTVDPSDLETIALQVRTVNALRELERFEEAEQLRTAIAIAPDAGGSGDRAARNREGWQMMLDRLAAPIARGDSSRFPIDMRGEREAAFRCIAPEREDVGEVPPLGDFEREYCATPEVAKEAKALRERLAEHASPAKSAK
ncbi:hypothetical protein [Stakelama tenebrarum]|uniref:Uncharacterized protein n=1 Tax=Stakelama tenebrarum TaxID=2711215 RepID=A0A6G6Y2H6_9SPHN|nr:hypothetical protein [Sphingosinithalassobacter tenebrarum]QIG79100.1 hypothetical protein G5C33_04400 [Sphingosinithalassobacter tenebrarum]